MKQISFLLLALFLFSSCKHETHLIKAHLQTIVKKDEIKTILQAHNIIQSPICYGYKQYKIQYSTYDIDKNEINASAIVALPLIKKDYYDIVINFHPTIFLKNKAPSTREPKKLSPIMLFSGQSNFITLEPDYIGFGSSSKSKHLYFIKKQAVQSNIDFFKATLEFLKNKKIKYRNIYFSGYSEGAFIALATLEAFEKEGFNVKMTIPMDGIYILEPIAKELLQYKRVQNASIITAVARSYALAHNSSYKSIFNPSVANKLDKLYSGNFSIEYINKHLPKKITGKDGLFKTSFVKNYEGSWFQKMLQANSTLNFSPHSKIRFLHCIGDDAIPYQVAYETNNFFRQYLFADSKITPVENFITQNNKTTLRLSHKQCIFAAYKIANFFFLLESQKR